MINEDTAEREKRSSVIVRASVRSPGRSDSVERRVRNLSRSGACIEHAGELRAGDRLQMSMGALAGLQAEVVWTREKLAGIRFGQTVDLEAARKPRGGAALPKAGWINQISNPYRR